MRKIYFLIVVLAVMGLSFSACKKDATVKPKVANVIGKWKTTSANEEYFFKDKPIGLNVEESTNGYVDHIEFNADGTGVMYFNSQIIRKFSYDSADSKIHFSSVLSYDGKSFVPTPSFMYIINGLTDNELVIAQEYYYYDQTHFYENKQYDKTVQNIHFTKEN